MTLSLACSLSSSISSLFHPQRRLVPSAARRRPSSPIRTSHLAGNSGVSASSYCHGSKHVICTSAAGGFVPAPCQQHTTRGLKNVRSISRCVGLTFCWLNNLAVRRASMTVDCSDHTAVNHIMSQNNPGFSHRKHRQPPLWNISRQPKD